MSRRALITTPIGALSGAEPYMSTPSTRDRFLHRRAYSARHVSNGRFIAGDPLVGVGRAAMPKVHQLHGCALSGEAAETRDEQYAYFEPGC